jgi:hypothetical protein
LPVGKHDVAAGGKCLLVLLVDDQVGLDLDQRLGVVVACASRRLLLLLCLGLRLRLRLLKGQLVQFAPCEGCTLSTNAQLSSISCMTRPRHIAAHLLGARLPSVGTFCLVAR